MKVNCESCGKPITAQVNSLFEQFEPGRVVCPHCHHQQKRYISEADLLIYFCFSAVLYSIVLVRQYRAQTFENSVHSVYARRVHVWYAAGIYPLLLHPDRRLPRADRD